MNIIGKIFGVGRFNRASSKDFRPEDLPETRVKLFFDTLGIRWSSMVGVNLLYVLFWMPAIIWSGINFLALQQQLIAVESTEFAIAQLYPAMNIFLLILWPLIALTGPATAGVSYVMRNWARGEHSFVFSDFFEQFRKNWKQALVVSTITGALPYLVFQLWRFYSGMIESVSKLFIIPQALVFLVALAWMLMLQVLYMLIVTYKLSFRQLLKNAMLLALGRLPQFVGIRLLTSVLPIVAYLAFITSPDAVVYVMMFVGFFYMVFGFALNRLLYASLGNAVCEKYINAQMGEPVDIGLRPKQ